MAASSSKQEVERKRGGRRGEKKGNILRNRTSEFQRRIALARGARVVAPVSVIRRVMIRPVIPIHCIIPRYKRYRKVKSGLWPCGLLKYSLHLLMLLVNTIAFYCFLFLFLFTLGNCKPS